MPARLKTLINAYVPTCVEQDFRPRMLALLSRAPQCFDRAFYDDGHFTASAWIVNHSRTHAVLVHHAAFDAWYQPGGHCDGNPDVQAMALQEAVEETGIPALRPLLGGAIFDLDIHGPLTHRGTPLHCHYDIRLAFEAPDNAPLALETGKAHAIQWAPLRDMAQYTAEDSILRMTQKTLSAIQDAA